MTTEERRPITMLFGGPYDEIPVDEVKSLVIWTGKQEKEYLLRMRVIRGKGGRISSLIYPDFPPSDGAPLKETEALYQARSIGEENHWFFIGETSLTSSESA